MGNEREIPPDPGSRWCKDSSPQNSPIPRLWRGQAEKGVVKRFAIVAPPAEYCVAPVARKPSFCRVTSSSPSAGWFVVEIMAVSIEMSLRPARLAGRIG